MSVEARLAELGIVMAGAPKPRFTYAPCVLAGDLIFVSGQIATENGRPLHPGKLGREVDVVRGQEAARACAISLPPDFVAAQVPSEEAERELGRLLTQGEVCD